MALNYLPFLNNPVKKPTGHEPLASFVDRLKSGAINYDGQPIEADERPVFTGAGRGPRADVLMPTLHPPAFLSDVPLPFHEEIYNANALHVPDLISIGRARAEVEAVAREREIAKMYVPTKKEGLVTLYDSEIASLESRIQEQRFAMTRGGHDAAVVEAQLGRDYQALRDLLNKREEARTGVTPTTLHLERKLMGELEMPADALTAAEAARASVAAGGGVDYARIGAVLNPMGRVGKDLYGRDYANRRREVDASVFASRGDPDRAPALLHAAAKVPALGATPAGPPGPGAAAASPAVPPGAGDGVAIGASEGSPAEVLLAALLAEDEAMGVVNPRVPGGFLRGGGFGRRSEVALAGYVPPAAAGAGASGRPATTPARPPAAAGRTSPAEVHVTPPKSSQKSSRKASEPFQQLASTARALRREREETFGYPRSAQLSPAVVGGVAKRMKGARALKMGIGPKKAGGGAAGAGAR